MQLNMYNLNCPKYRSWFLHYTGMDAFSTGNFTYCSTAFPKKVAFWEFIKFIYVNWKSDNISEKIFEDFSIYTVKL